MIRGEGARTHEGTSGLLEAPAHVFLPAQDVESLSYLKILDREGRELVTVIELLSPTNKRPGNHRAQYLSKRSAVARPGPPGRDRPVAGGRADARRGAARMHLLRARQPGRPPPRGRLLAVRRPRSACRPSRSPFGPATPTPGSTSGRYSTGSTTNRATRTTCTDASPTRR